MGSFKLKSLQPSFSSAYMLIYNGKHWPCPSLRLHSQACQLKRDTITYEEKEQQLVSDCVKELRECDALKSHTHMSILMSAMPFF